MIVLMIADSYHSAVDVVFGSFMMVGYFGSSAFLEDVSPARGQSPLSPSGRGHGPFRCPMHPAALLSGAFLQRSGDSEK